VPRAGKSETPRLDERTDIVQLAMIALTLLLGRPLRPHETPDRLPALLDQAEQTCGPASPSVAFLRNWLARALQIDGRLFGSAADAHEALADLPYERGHSRRDFSRMLAPLRNFDVGMETAADEQPVQAEPIVLHYPFTDEAVVLSPRPELSDPSHADQPGSALHDEASLSWGIRHSAPLESPLFSDERDVVPLVASSTESARTEHVLPPSSDREHLSSDSTASQDLAAAQRVLGIMTPARKSLPLWITAAVALVAAGEAAVIGGLLYVKAPFRSAAITIESVQPGSDVIVDGRSVGVTPLRLSVDSKTKSVRVTPPAAAAIAQSRPSEGTLESSPEAGAHPAVAPPIARPGGLRLSSTVDVDVLENGRLLGSSARPIVMTPGSHQLELVNAALGYRARETVVVKVGQTTALAISLPNGRLSINALPWAEVWIDDKLVGETPLGNLSIPIGAHQVVFRHPQLGERRESAVVRADTVSRVSVNLQQ